MLKILLLNPWRQFSVLKISTNKFEARHYKTMCLLLKQRYPIYNELIEINKDIKLLDDKGKLIGRYEASEARKKAANMNKDLILINANSDPVICKVSDFRGTILHKFYNQIVVNKNEQLLRRAATTKQIRVSLTATQSELQIKTKQILELAKKSLNVRIFINCKESQIDQAYGKMEYIKSLVQNRCVIERDVENLMDSDEEEGRGKDSRKTISITVKSKNNEYLENLAAKKQPESVLQEFLRRFDQQKDVDMMDLKAEAEHDYAQKKLIMGIESEQSQTPSEKKSVQAQEEVPSNKSKSYRDEMNKSQESFIEIRDTYFVQREAKAKILNQRLRRILELQIK